MAKILSRMFSTEKILRNHPPLGEVPDSSQILRRTVKVAWPSMLEAFLMAAVAFVDTLMVSSLGDAAIAAVGITSQPRLLFFALFFGLQPAVSALVARRRGEDRQMDALRILKVSLVFCVFLVAILSTSSVLLADPILRLVGSHDETHDMAVGYFRILMSSMFFSALTLVINAAQRGAGNTKISMRTNIVSNLVNVVGNYLLIGGNLGFPALGVQGAAIATVFGQFCGFVMALISLLQVNGYLYIFHKSGKIFDREAIKSLFKLWPSTFVEQLILRVGFLLYAVIVNRLGFLALATHQIAINFMMISFAFGDGLSVAAIALVGYSLGQKRSDLAKVYGAFCQRIGLICSALVSVVFIIWGRDLYALFSDNEQVLQDGTIIMWLLCVIVLFQISQIIFSGCLRGAGDTKFITAVSFIGIGILRPSLAYVFSTVLGFGIVGAWASLIVDQTIRLVMTAIRFYRGKWTTIKI